MKTMFFLAISLLAINDLFSQINVPSQYDNHWYKSYIANGLEVSVGIKNENYKSNKPKIRNIVIRNQADLILQYEYYESGNIKSIGYFRLIYDLTDENYRWVPDLLCTYYDENCVLINQILFCNGEIIKDPK